MKRLAGWVALCCVGLRMAYAEPAPRIEVDAPTVMLGDHFQRRPLAHSFSFKNTGTADLTVRVTQTSCGCTAAVVSDEVVAPGTAGSIRMEYAPNAEKPRLGNQSFVITLETNDPQHRTVVLQANARLTAPVAASPEALDFGTAPGDGGDKTLPLTVSCDQAFGPVKVLSVEALSPDVRVTPLPLADPESEVARYRYEVTLASAATRKNYRTTLLVRTDSAETPLVEVPVKAQSTSPFATKPSALLFGTVHPGDEVSRRVVLRARGPGLAPVRVQCKEEWLTPALEADTVPGQWTLTVVMRVPEDRARMEKVKSSVAILDGEGATLAAVDVFGLIVPREEADN